MSATSLLYNVLVLASAFLSLGLACYAAVHDRRLAGRSFALLMLATAEWSFAYVFADFAPDPSIRLLWIGAAYIGIAFAGPLWLLFALANTGRIELLPRWAPLAILSAGGLSLVVVLANLALAIASLGVAGAAARDGTLHGPLFWLHTLIAYTALLAGVAACARTLATARSPYRQQAMMMLLGVLLPLLVNVVYLSNVLGAPAADLTPIALGGSSLLFAYAARRHQMLTIRPIARQVVLDSMRDGLIVVDQAGLLVEHNPAAAALAGIGERAEGKPLADATRDRALAAVLRDMLSDAGASERSVNCNEREPRRIQITRTPLADATGRPQGTLFMLRDVSEEMRTAQALARQAADLTTLHHVASAVGATLDARALLQAIVTTTRDALGMAHATVGLIDERRCELRIIAESDAADGASAVGATLSLRGPFEQHWQSGAPLAFEDALADERLALLRGLLARRNTRGLLVVPLRANDRLIGTLNLASPTPYQFDREELALAQMIAGYVAAALANAQLFETSQQAVRAKSAILDAVSHEFRTPITAILGFTELYQENVLGPVTEEQQEALEAIYRNGHRLLKLVDDLLDLARLEAGKLDLLLYPVEVSLCVREATGLMQAQIRQKQLGLRLEIADDLPMALADSMWLRRVLVNLLTNAVRFTSAGEITVRAYADDRPPTTDHQSTAYGANFDSLAAGPSSSVVIEVEDTGTGIPELEQQTIFEAFRRAEDTGHTIPNGAGSGLGLAISKRASDQMEGQLSVRSQTGQGSTFTIALRMAELALEHPRH
jgi:PAS domain S-box-containing protein